MPRSKEVKAPSVTVAFELDWSTRLTEESARIISSEWLVPDALNLIADEQAATSTAVALAGGSAGMNYRVVNRVVFSSGVSDEWVLDLSVSLPRERTAKVERESRVARVPSESRTAKV